MNYFKIKKTLLQMILALNKMDQDYLYKTDEMSLIMNCKNILHFTYLAHFAQVFVNNKGVKKSKWFTYLDWQSWLLIIYRYSYYTSIVLYKKIYKFYKQTIA